jgi:hypothetical protein
VCTVDRQVHCNAKLLFVVVSSCFVHCSQWIKLLKQVTREGRHYSSSLRLVRVCERFVSEDDDIVEFLCCTEAQAFLFVLQEASSTFLLGLL